MDEPESRKTAFGRPLASVAIDVFIIPKISCLLWGKLEKRNGIKSVKQRLNLFMGRINLLLFVSPFFKWAHPGGGLRGCNPHFGKFSNLSDSSRLSFFSSQK